MIGSSDPVSRAGVVLLAVFALNALEFVGLLGQFPRYGTLAMFALAGLGGVAVLLAIAIVPLRTYAKSTTVALLEFGLTLLLGYVPLYLAFGCVFYGCPG